MAFTRAELALMTKAQLKSLIGDLGLVRNKSKSELVSLVLNLEKDFGGLGDTGIGYGQFVEDTPRPGRGKAPDYRTRARGSSPVPAGPPRQMGPPQMKVLKAPGRWPKVSPAVRSMSLAGSAVVDEEALLMSLLYGPEGGVAQSQVTPVKAGGLAGARTEVLTQKELAEEAKFLKAKAARKAGERASRLRGVGGGTNMVGARAGEAASAAGREALKAKSAAPKGLGSLLKRGGGGLLRALGPVAYALTAYEILRMLEGDDSQGSEDVMERAIAGKEFAGAMEAGDQVRAMRDEVGRVDRLSDVSMMTKTLNTRMDRELSTELRALVHKEQEILQQAAVDQQSGLAEALAAKGLV